jgi:hypothetical protein
MADQSHPTSHIERFILGAIMHELGLGWDSSRHGTLTMVLLELVKL